MELSLPGAKIQWNIRSRERKFPGAKYPWNFHSRERKFHGTFDPKREKTRTYACYCVQQEV